MILKRCLIGLFLATSIHFSVFSLKNYFSHINLTIGIVTPLGFSYSGENEVYKYSVEDGFGNYYYNSFNSSVFGRYTPGMELGFRFPFYYNDNLSTGVALKASIFNMDMVNGSMVGNGAVGLFFEYKLNTKFSLLGNANIGFNMADGGGKLKAAYPGDPGYYDGSTFHAPGSDFSITGTSTPLLNIGASVKYHLTQYVFLEVGYNFIFKSTVNKFDANLDGKTLKLDESPKNMKINNYSIIYLSVGFGV